MNRIIKGCRLCLWTLSGLVLLTGSGWGYEINEMFSIGGVMAGIYQYESISSSTEMGYDSLGRGLFAIQPEAGFRPTEKDEVFVKFGFGAGNGLMEEGRSPFILAPWAGDTEDSVKNMNGRNRNYLLTAWYKHTFTFSENHSLSFTGGIIDATDYMDENAYSNDEYTQFMNEALVNAPNAFLPSYDLGAAFEWDLAPFSVKGVAMALGSNGEEGVFDQPYNAYLMQLAYAAEPGLGQGNYRFVFGASSDSFSNPEGTDTARRICAIASFDQELGDSLGAWIRFGWQNDAAVLNYSSIYSGGFNIKGTFWGRPCDTIGIGYAHLNGGNQNVDHTHVFETYVRIALNDIFALTGDVQYMKDAMKAEESPEGWIFGLRATAEF